MADVEITKESRDARHGLCPYVRTQYEMHPEWADVFTTKPGGTP